MTIIIVNTKFKKRILFLLHRRGVEETNRAESNGLKRRYANSRFTAHRFLFQKENTSAAYVCDKFENNVWQIWSEGESGGPQADKGRFRDRKFDFDDRPSIQCDSSSLSAKADPGSYKYELFPDLKALFGSDTCKNFLPFCTYLIHVIKLQGNAKTFL